MATTVSAPRSYRAYDAIIALDGVQLHYRDWGDPGAPPVVLVHGSGLTAQAYDGLASGLAQRWRVLALDLRGHGLSDRAADYHWERALGDLEVFVQRLAAGPIRLVGHSIGAQLGAALAARRPDLVAGLVLIDWAPGATFTPEYAQALAQLFGIPLIEDPLAVLEGALQGQPRLRPEEFGHVIVTNLAPHPEGGWVWCFDPQAFGPDGLAFSIDEPTSRSFVQQVGCPTLLIRAVGSQYVTRTQAEETVDQLRDGRLIEVPESGHGLPWEQPEQVLEVVRTFLSTASTGRGQGRPGVPRPG